jgi:hypothetical protein
LEKQEKNEKGRIVFIENISGGLHWDDMSLE